MRKQDIQTNIKRSEKWNILLIADSLLIFLNISNTYSIIPYLVFFQYYRAINTGLIAIINVVYLFVRFGGRKIFIDINNPLFILYLIINILNIYFGFLTNTFGWGMFPYIFSNTIFYILLLNLFKRYIQTYSFDRSFWLIVRGYIWLCLLSMAGVLTLFFLIKVFKINPLFNNIDSLADLFRSDVATKVNRHYFFPFNIAIIQTTTSIKIPFFQDYGIITGLFHEGHTSTFLVIPSIFLIFNRIKYGINKIVICTAYLLVILIASSTTNILSLLACLAVFAMIEFRRTIILPILLIGIFYITYLIIDPSHYGFIIDKIFSRSADYSLSTIIFAFKPKTIIGTSFFNLAYWDHPNSPMNVGYIIFFLNLIFLIIFIFRITMINFSKNIQSRFIGLFLLYFFLHSMKVAMVTYSLSQLMLVLFIIKIYSGKSFESFRKRIYSPTLCKVS